MGGVVSSSSSLSDMDLSDTDFLEIRGEGAGLEEEMEWSEREPEMEPLEARPSGPWTTPITLVWRLLGQASRNLDWATPCSL